MNKKRFVYLSTSGKFLLVSLLLIIGVFSFVRFASAAVSLLYFFAEAEGNQVRIEWGTATELDNAGFLVLRSTTGGNDPSQYVQVPVYDPQADFTFNFIPARGDGLTGKQYLFYDENVNVGTRYYYFLQDIDVNNTSTYHGPVEAVAGQTATPTQAVTPTQTNTPAPTQGATNTPTATSTTVNNSGSTPTRTVTPGPTATANPTSTPGEPTEVPPAGLEAIDITLTAVAAEVAAFPTESPTVIALAQSNGRLATATPTPAEAVNRTDAGADSSPSIFTGRVQLLVFFILISGGLLTWGILSIARKNIDDEDALN